MPKDAGDCQAYWQWKAGEQRGSWKPYKATLYVSIQVSFRDLNPRINQNPWTLT